MEPENHGKSWTPEDKKELKELFLKNLSVEDIALRVKRKPNAVVAQLERLSLVVNKLGLVYKLDPNLYYNGRKSK